MRVFLLIFSALALMGADGAVPKRVASTSLCGDSYVMSMASPNDILALSWQSGDALSAAPKSMRSKPKAWDDAERLLYLKPDLVVFGAGEGEIAKPLLDKAGIAHMNIAWGEDFTTVISNGRTLGHALGIVGKTPPYISPKTEKPSLPKPTLLYLSSSGATAGPGTYIDAAIQFAGGTNIITKTGWHTPDPETLVALKPDLIITSFFNDSYASINEAGLRNTVLQNKIHATPSVNVPGKLWPCAGPELYEASNLIAKAIAELRQ